MNSKNQKKRDSITIAIIFSGMWANNNGSKEIIFLMLRTLNCKYKVPILLLKINKQTYPMRSPRGLWKRWPHAILDLFTKLTWLDFVFYYQIGFFPHSKLKEATIHTYFPKASLAFYEIEYVLLSLMVFIQTPL